MTYYNLRQGRRANKPIEGTGNSNNKMEIDEPKKDKNLDNLKKAFAGLSINKIKKKNQPEYIFFNN